MTTWRRARAVGSSWFISCGSWRGPRPSSGSGSATCRSSPRPPPRCRTWRSSLADDGRRRPSCLAELRDAAGGAARPDPAGPQRPLPGDQRRAASTTGSAGRCRCGRSWRCAAAAARSSSRSATAPTPRAGFTDAKDPDRVPDRRDTYVGQQVTIFDNRGICQHSGLCTDRLATVFHSRRRSRSSPPAAAGWTRSSGPCGTARPGR